MFIVSATQPTNTKSDQMQVVKYKKQNMLTV